MKRLAMLFVLALCACGRGPAMKAISKVSFGSINKAPRTFSISFGGYMYSCNPQENTVLPSDREIAKYAEITKNSEAYLKLLADHTYCEPDSLGK
jgi:hypothetical protein